MWSVGSEPAQVYIGRTTVGVWAPGTPPCDVRWEAVASAQEGWQRALTLLSELELKTRRRRVAVWLSGALARPFMFEPVQGLRRRSEAIQIAAGLAPEATGLEGPSEVWMDDWSPQRASLAIAFDRGLRTDLEAAATQQGIRLMSLRPWWTRALNEALAHASTDLRLLAADEPDSMTLICGVDGQFGSASSFSPKPEPSQTAAVLTRALLGADATAAQAARAVLSTEVAVDVIDATALSRPFASRTELLA